MNIIVKGFRVLCEFEKRKYGSIEVPTPTGAVMNNTCPVLTVRQLGDEKLDDDGKVVPYPCKPGDRVIVQCNPLEVRELQPSYEFEDKLLVIVPAEKIFCVVEGYQERAPAPKIESPSQIIAASKAKKQLLTA